MESWRATGIISEGLQRWRVPFRFVPLLEQRAEEPHRKVNAHLSLTSAMGAPGKLGGAVI